MMVYPLEMTICAAMLEKVPSDICIQHAVWSESSLSAWRNLASLALQNAPIEDSDQTAQILGIHVQRYVSDVGAHIVKPLGVPMQRLDTKPQQKNEDTNNPEYSCCLARVFAPLLYLSHNTSKRSCHMQTVTV